jgi:hypothetical protein
MQSAENLAIRAACQATPKLAFFIGLFLRLGLNLVSWLKAWMEDGWGTVAKISFGQLGY